MVDIRERQAQRDRVLVAVYELTDGSSLNGVGRVDIAAETGMSDDQVEEARRWLREHGLVESMSAAGDVCVTPEGSDRAEALLADGQSSQAQITLSIPEQRLLERFVLDVRNALDSSNLEGDDLVDADAQLATIEAQMRSPRPRRDVIGAAIRGLTWVGREALSGVIGGAMYAGLLALAA